MDTNDYYQVLGVGRDATAEQIKAAYRRCAMKYHPDRNPGDREAEERFKQCQAAYDVLGDENKRRMYDRGGDSNPFAGFSGAGHDGGLDDLFASIFSGFANRQGSAASNRRSTAGEDIHLRLTLDLEQAVLGVRQTIRYQLRTKCGTCDGTGSKTKRTKTCVQCSGAGQVRIRRGVFMMSSPCPGCQGKGEVPEQTCGACRGNGSQITQKEVEISIPAGVDDGDMVRVAEHGHWGRPNGDLYLNIAVRPHPVFQRQGLDLHTQIKIRPSQAALGSTVAVSTPHGKIEVKIPEGTQHGTVLRVKGKGVRSQVRNATGDLMCHVDIQIPVNLTREQRKLLEKLEKTYK